MTSLEGEQIVYIVILESYDFNAYVLVVIRPSRGSGLNIIIIVLLGSG